MRVDHIICNLCRQEIKREHWGDLRGIALNAVGKSPSERQFHRLEAEESSGFEDAHADAHFCLDCAVGLHHFFTEKYRKVTTA